MVINNQLPPPQLNIKSGYLIISGCGYRGFIMNDLAIMNIKY